MINYLDNPPKAVRVKKYQKGWAVELLYDTWQNLHALLEDLPETYYFNNQPAADKIAAEIKKQIK